ncbi:MAG: DEAD/DEAH box helicase [Armatimonadetes bacterium]|nr:DEAD/DEAH box helicase [Armatimonadota bacterium]
MTPREFLARLRRLPDYRRQLLACRILPAQPARFGSLARPLPDAVAASLQAQGIERLYTHQASAVDAARAGADVTIVTSTASGKTLCYNLPVVERLLAEPAARALYLYPTKALAQDQLGKLNAWDFFRELRPATYDGDTPRDERGLVRRKARVILSNPDMLHVSILPNHPAWASFLASLRFVVVDEVHAYRGVFGSHVALVLRRLQRLCEHYGSRPQFLCTSATIANPQAHVERLLGRPTHLVAEDGAPRGERWFALWNPPLLDAKTGERRSAITEATQLFVEMAKAGVRNITFTRARVVAELILRYAQASLRAGDEPLRERIAAYRAGYRAEQRRQLEQRLFHGDLVGVVATNALELGVDVGGLDAVVLVGFPGTIASTWQQAGRAGRSQRPALALMVALDNPLDQFLARNPHYLFEQPPEQATIDPGNPYILLRHLVCAAMEKPLGPEDQARFGPLLARIADALVEAGELRSLDSRYYWSGTGYPARDVDIRSAGGAPYSIFNCGEGDRLLGTVDAETAFRVVYPGAIYLHQGDSYAVERLDLEARAAYVRPVNVPYYTTPRVQSSVTVEEERESHAVGGAQVAFGEVTATTHVIGYRKHRLFSEEVLEQADLDLPPRSYRTEGLWLTVPVEAQVAAAPQGVDLLGAIHAIEHAALAVAPLFAMCDRWDLDGTSHPNPPDLGLPTIFLHDAYPGGVGIADRCYREIEALLARTREAIEGCECEAGCPGCIHSPTCGSMNEPLDKAGAVWLLQRLLGMGQSETPA